MPFDVVIHSFADVIHLAVDRLQQVAVPGVIPVVLTSGAFDESHQHSRWGQQSDSDLNPRRHLTPTGFRRTQFPGRHASQNR